MSNIFDDQNNHSLTKISRNSNTGKSITRTASLTGTLTALPSEKCRCVELINNANALFISAHDGGSVEAVDPSAIPIYCKNANEVKVKGTGTLSYVVIK